MSMEAALPPSLTGFDRPATYGISVQGCVPASWSDRLEGMAITDLTAEAGPPMTKLLGELADQAALEGVLKTLFEMHLSVVSVERLSAE
jgi:hypothetical protein